MLDYTTTGCSIEFLLTSTFLYTTGSGCDTTHSERCSVLAALDRMSLNLILLLIVARSLWPSQQSKPIWVSTGALEGALLLVSTNLRLPPIPLWANWTKGWPAPFETSAQGDQRYTSETHLVGSMPGPPQTGERADLFHSGEILEN